MKRLTPSVQFLTAFFSIGEVENILKIRNDSSQEIEIIYRKLENTILRQWNYEREKHQNFLFVTFST